MKKALSIILSILMVVCVLPVSLTASAATKGITGDCIWSLDGTVLTIKGNGNMEDYDFITRPWDNTITEVIIEYGVTNIGNRAFDGCKVLKSVVIPNSITSIGDWAFKGCEELKSVIFPNSVINIGWGVFENCTELTNISLGDGVSYIYYATFENCTKLKSIIIPSGVPTIVGNTFKNCTELTTVTIPKSVKSISENAFSGCDNLTDIYYEGSEFDWLNISVYSGNDVLETATIHYNYKPTTIRYGLVTNNKEISTIDALIILHAVVGKIQFTADQKMAGDVDGDDDITTIDALLVLQFVVGKIDNFPVEE